MYLVEPQVGGGDGVCLDISFLQLPDLTLAAEGHFVKSVGAVNDQRVFRAENSQYVGHLLAQLRVGDTDELGPGPGGIRQGAEHVEDGAYPDFTAGPCGESHGWMEDLREHEPDSDRFEAGPDPIGAEVDLDAKRFENVGAAGGAGHRAVAVLGDPHTRARDDEGGGRGDIERV